MAVKQSYTDFIALVTARELSGQYKYYLSGVNQDIPSYYLFVYDGPQIYEEDIQDSDSVTHFETNYKSSWNKPIEKREPGTGLIQYKPRPVEATLYAQFIYFTTGVADSLDAPNDSWYIDVSTPGLTKVGARPPYNYYIDGGGYQLIGNMDGNSRIKFIMAPNIPEQYGGNVYLIQNKKIVRNDDSFVLEVPPKFVKYYPENPYANEIQIYIEHDEHSRMQIEFYARFYK